jgi:hypothetical protein
MSCSPVTKPSLNQRSRVEAAMPSTLAGRRHGEQLSFLLARLVTGLVAADSVVVPQ